MRNLLLAAFAALGLTAAIAPMAQAFPGEPTTTRHSGPYDNTQNSLGGRFVGGGDSGGGS